MIPEATSVSSSSSFSDALSYTPSPSVPPHSQTHASLWLPAPPSFLRTFRQTHGRKHQHKCAARSQIRPRQIGSPGDAEGGDGGGVTFMW